MEFTARQIAEFLNGEIIGDPDARVNNVSRIEEGKLGTLAFLANPKYEKYLYTTGASIVLVGRGFKPSGEVAATLIRVDDAYQAIARLLELREQMKPVPSGIDEKAHIDATAQLGEDVFVGPFAVVSAGAVIGKGAIIDAQVYIGENVVIGEKTRIYPGVKIYHECRVGSSCTLHAGAVVGSDGFGFAPGADRNYRKIPQVGNVIIEDYVEIGANTIVDRAMMGSTIIRKGVKLDNLIQVAHNVEIGENTVIAAQSGIAGSSKVGANCMIGGQVGISGHLVVGNGVKIAAQSGIGSDIPDNEVIQGSPAYNVSKYQRSYVLFKKLPELWKQLGNLEEELKKLKCRK